MLRASMKFTCSSATRRSTTWKGSPPILCRSPSPVANPRRRSTRRTSMSVIDSTSTPPSVVWFGGDSVWAFAVAEAARKNDSPLTTVEPDCSTVCAATSRVTGTRYGEQLSEVQPAPMRNAIERGSPACSPHTPMLIEGLSFRASEIAVAMRVPTAT